MICPLPINLLLNAEINQRPKANRFYFSRFFKSLLFSVFSTALILTNVSNASDDFSAHEDLWEIDSAPSLGNTGAGLFTIPVPGETFSASTATVGHAATDFELSGNGILSYGLVRKFEAIPHEHSYPFGNMSFDIPMLQFKALFELAPHQMTCDTFSAGLSDDPLFNDVQFSGSMGSASLIPKTLVNQNFRNLYPGNAVLVSENNYYIACDGVNYKLYAPDGTVFTFKAQFAGETWASGHITGPHNLNDANSTRDFPYQTFKIYVKEIERLNSRLVFEYEAIPSITLSRGHSAGQTYTEVRDNRVREPLSSSEYQTLFSASRLTSVTLHAGSDGSGSIAHTLAIQYHANNALCPGLVSQIRQTYGGTTTRRMVYDYRVLDYLEATRLGAPRSGCLLEKVREGNQTNPNNGTLYEQWSFEYGVLNLSNQSTRNDLYMDSTENRKADHKDNWLRRYGYRHVPLRKVTAPTGLEVKYEYFNEVRGTQTQINRSKRCEYSGYKSRTKCSESRGGYTPAVSVRKVSGYNMAPHTSTIHLQREDDHYYNVFIGDTKLQHRLNFRRIVPTETISSSALANNHAAHSRRLMEGRLIRHEIHEMLPNGGTRLHAKVENDYHEFTDGGVFSIEVDSRPHLAKPADKFKPYNGYTWKNERRGYLISSRRIRLRTTTVTIDGKKYQTHIEKLDNYGNTSEVFERQLNAAGDVEHERKRNYTYDNNHAGRPGWIVGLVKDTLHSYGEGVADVKDSNKYSVTGLLIESTKSGFTTKYTYHNNGNLKTVTDGNNNRTIHQSYKRGVARRTIHPNNGNVIRVVNNWGDVTRETVDVDIATGQKAVTAYQYIDPYRRLSKIIPPAGRAVTTILNPIWRGNGRRLLKQTTVGDQRSTEHYDALGRVWLSVVGATSGTDTRKVEMKYDARGNETFVSDVVAGNASSNTGYNTKYDFLGRPIERSHSSDTGNGFFSTEYCYGPDCNNVSRFLGRTPLNNGYVVRDQKGYLTFYETRGFGAQTEYQVMRIRQQVERGASADEVITTMTRSDLADLTSVKQGGQTRTYEPFYKSGRPTRLPGKETHPEFGSLRIANYDGAGNATSIQHYNGNYSTRGYDSMNRLIAVSGVGAFVDSAATQRESYTYTTAGWLKTASNNDNHWTYAYSDDGLITSATLRSHGETFTTGYQHDSRGRVQKVTYPGGTELSYTYNAHGQPKSAAPYVTDAEYGTDGLPTMITYGDGSVRKIGYTGRKQVDTLSVTRQGNEILDLDYDYTGRGNLERLTGEAGAGHKVSLDLNNLRYDGLSRLTRVDGPWGIGQYTYDVLGNIKTKNVGGQNITMQYDGVNRLFKATINHSGLQSIRRYQYDRNGNVKSDALNDYHYDRNNRLITSTSPGSAAGQDIVQTNSYDTHGHRTRIQLDDGTRESTTYFVYSQGGELLHEYDPATGERRDHMQFLGKRVATLITHNGFDSDQDGLPDYFERLNGLSVYASGDQNEDPDGDGASNLLEYQFGLAILDTDTDNDGTSDFYEIPPSFHELATSFHESSPSTHEISPTLFSADSSAPTDPDTYMPAVLQPLTQP